MKYVIPKSLDYALNALEAEGNFILAGGTDLLRLEKSGGIKIDTLVDITNIPEMGRIEIQNDGLKIGAAVTLNEITENRLITEKYPILREAATVVASPQVRNMGTIGGNLLQDVQCWYYRNSQFHCTRKGGKICYAVRGEHRWYHSIYKPSPCFATWTSDMAPALAALGASAVIMGRGGERTAKVEDLYLSKSPWREVKRDEILTGIEIPRSSLRGKFLKHGIWSPPYFPMVNVAAAIELDDDICKVARIFLGGVSPILYRATKTEESLKERALDKDTIKNAAGLISEEAKPLRDNSFKVQISKVLLERVLSCINKVVRKLE